MLKMYKEAKYKLKMLQSANRNALMQDVKAEFQRPRELQKEGASDDDFDGGNSQHQPNIFGGA
jgi:hypothetical protein